MESNTITAERVNKDDALPENWKDLGYHELNAMLNLYGSRGEIQFGADREAARQYFLQNINNNTVFFHDLEEKIDYLIKNDYYEKATFDQYEQLGDCTDTDWQIIGDAIEDAARELGLEA